VTCKEADVARYNYPEGTEPFRQTVAALVQRVLLPQGTPKVGHIRAVPCTALQ